VEALLKEGDRTGAVQLVQGAVVSLKESRVKPDSVLNSALATLVAKQPGLFSGPSVIEGLVGVLKKEQTLAFKLKSNPVPLILASQLLAVSLNKSRNWPESLAVAYVNDALGTRLWVDLEECKKLVDNIVTMFHTTSPPGVSRPAPSGEGAPTKWEVPLINLEEVSVEPRFTASVESSVKTFSLQLLQEQIKKPQHNELLSRNILQFLVNGAGWFELRIIAAQRLEGWLQNPKLTRLCQDLLSSLSANVQGGDGTDDGKVVEQLVSIRLRSKVLANHYINCVRDVMLAHSDHLEIAMRTVVANELGPARNTGNMQLIVTMVTAEKDRSAKVLADVFLGLLVKKEDYHRSLRGLLREIVRQMKHSFSYSVFTRQLMQENRDSAFQQLDQTAKVCGT
jgi:integrator complex subunit 1